jgi:hypothetical protein
MEQNKTSQYFKYAIGEIILVVIGILIALQINNWNEQRKANILEAEYYCRLLEDLIQDGEQIDALIDLSENRLKASNQAVRLLQQDKANTLKVAEQIALAIKAIYTDFRPNNSAFEDLKSGANLSIIKDKTVIKALNTYFNNVESLKSVIKVNGENAVDIYYAHDDSFANGKTPSSILSGRFKQGMDPDVRKAITIDTTSTLSKTMHNRLYNEALRYTSANTRQLELYNVIKDFTTNLTTILKRKCDKNDD